MGYSFNLISKDKPIEESDYKTAIKNLSAFNLGGDNGGRLVCDIDYHLRYIRISGSFSISGEHAEGFVLNMLMNMLELGYKPKVISRDWSYGTEDDFKWLNEQ